MFIIRDINEKRRRRAGAALAALACWPAAAWDAAADDATCAPARDQRVLVESVDIHLEARLADGRKLLLRGIDPPRGTPSNPRLAEQARNFLDALVAGRMIVADVDSVARDRWGRFPAMLALPEGGMVAGLLLRAGWARVEPAGADAACRVRLLEWENEARQARRGLWADPAYAILPADERQAFAGRGGETIIVEGTVASVGQWRTLTFLNLGRDRRADASILLSRRIAAALEKQGRSMASLTGVAVRARGLLQMRTAPRIEIFSPGALEILSAPAKSPSSRHGTPQP